eukprot:766482-Hanusia_phi.AAC.3
MTDGTVVEKSFPSTTKLKAVSLLDSRCCHLVPRPSSLLLAHPSTLPPRPHAAAGGGERSPLGRPAGGVDADAPVAAPARTRTSLTWLVQVPEEDLLRRRPGSDPLGGFAGDAEASVPCP